MLHKNTHTHLIKEIKINGYYYLKFIIIFSNNTKKKILK